MLIRLTGAGGVQEQLAAAGAFIMVPHPLLGAGGVHHIHKGDLVAQGFAVWIAACVTFCLFRAGGRAARMGLVGGILIADVAAVPMLVFVMIPYIGMILMFGEFAVCPAADGAFRLGLAGGGAAGMGRLVLSFVAPGAGVIVGGLALGQLGGPVVAQGGDRQRFQAGFVLAVGVAEQLAAAVPGALPIGLGARRGAGGLHLRHGGELVAQGLNDLLLRYGRSADGTKRLVGRALFGAGSGLARFDLGFVGGMGLRFQLCFAAFVFAGIPVLFIIPGQSRIPAVAVLCVRVAVLVPAFFADGAFHTGRRAAGMGVHLLCAADAHALACIFVHIGPNVVVGGFVSGFAAVPLAEAVMVVPVDHPVAPVVAVLGVELAIFIPAYCAFCLFGASRRAAGMSNRIIRIIIRTLIVCTSIIME